MVKVGTDLKLDLLAREWLAKNDPQEPIRHERELDSEWIIEVSLEVAVNIKVDIISVVETEINEDWWETSADTDQFLVRGEIRELPSTEAVYLQGYGWKER